MPSGYLSLSDAVAAVGKELFAESWTGEETTYGYVNLEALKSGDRQEAILERENEIYREQTGREWRGSFMGGDPPALSDEDLTEIERELDENWAAREEAQQRLYQATGWLQERLWSGVVPAEVLTPGGQVYPVPTQLWGSAEAAAIFDSGKVKFHPAKYGWRWVPSAPPLAGRVTILEEHLHRAFSGAETPPYKPEERDAAGSDKVTPRPKGGRPPKYDWDAFWIEVVRIANTPDGLPERQGELVRHMLDWCGRTWEDSPSDTTVKDRLRPLYRTTPPTTET